MRQASTAGGVFPLLAEYILDEGGVVFGAALDEELQVRHIAVKDKAELPRLRGAKPGAERPGRQLPPGAALSGPGAAGAVLRHPLSGGRTLPLPGGAPGAAADLRRGVQRGVVPGGVEPADAVHGLYQAAAAGGRELLRQAAGGKGAAVPCALRRRGPV